MYQRHAAKGRFATLTLKKDWGKTRVCFLCFSRYIAISGKYQVGFNKWKKYFIFIIVMTLII